MSSASSPMLSTGVFTCSVSDLIDACLNLESTDPFCHSSGIEMSIGIGGAILYDGVATIPLLTPCTVNINYSANFDRALGIRQTCISRLDILFSVSG